MRPSRVVAKIIFIFDFVQPPGMSMSMGEAIDGGPQTAEKFFTGKSYKIPLTALDKNCFIFY
jgi:hypothetical protein